ncbi:MAG: aldo/keto reductase, partial [Glaciihabitans sp.]|nr:aldo/keto reductase [Glaciihabitans sp.]
LAARYELTPARAALAWIAQLDGVSTVIPGARSVEQAAANASAGTVENIDEAFNTAVTELYNRYFRAAVHDRW